MSSYVGVSITCLLRSPPHCHGATAIMIGTLSIVTGKDYLHDLHLISQVGDPEKEAACLLRNKNPSVKRILNDQNSAKWSREHC